ncbi:DUF6036 family nucleotidyltransferase [Dactylosporangium sp. CA-233914]|uniref:DUF6036 family nucleotidyltransferase n=1 Tax=Dactylosporangium sp. CA-233914 TaxID=3239934 RepID=UPI003D910A25
MEDHQRQQEARMRRDELEHALRAAADITGERTMFVIGSQSILGSYREWELPAAATVSREVDIGFFNDPGGHKADLIEGAIGEESDFDQTYGIYVDGVDEQTAALPNGWWERLVEVTGANTAGARGLCLEPHDCALSKLAAGREKDHAFVAALLDAGLINADVLAERAETMDVPPVALRRMLDWLSRWR